MFKIFPENNKLKLKKDYIKIKTKSTCHDLSSNPIVQSLINVDINDHLLVLQVISKIVYLKDPQITKLIKATMTKLLKITSYYAETDPVIAINSCAGIVNIINYSIKICPAMEKRLKNFIKTEIDFNEFQVCFSILKFVNYNLQNIKQNINSKAQLSKDDEQGFKNSSRVSFDHKLI